MNGADRVDMPGRLVVLGAGNWGTTLAALYAPTVPTRLWVRSAEQLRRMTKLGENALRLPGVRLPEQLRVERAGASALGVGDVLMVAVPSHAVREAVTPLAGEINGSLVVNAAKGLEGDSLRTMGELLDELLPASPVLTLSGPNIAREIAAGRPARAVLAGEPLAALARGIELLKHDRLRLEASRDRLGVEICGSLKGILAIGVGLAEGWELGDNQLGLMMTWGMAEFERLASFFGAEEQTARSIAGLGDIITSSQSPAGRNRRFGRLLAAGASRDEALAEVGMVVEGVRMLESIARLEAMQAPLPLFAEIKRVVDGAPGSGRGSFEELLLGYGLQGAQDVQNVQKQGKSQRSRLSKSLIRQGMAP